MKKMILLVVCFAFVFSGCNYNNDKNFTVTSYKSDIKTRAEHEKKIKRKIVNYVVKNSKEKVKCEIINYFVDSSGVFANLKIEKNSKKYLGIVYGSDESDFNVENFHEYEIFNSKNQLFNFEVNFKNPTRTSTIISGIISNPKISKVKVLTDDGDFNLINIDQSNPSFIYYVSGSKHVLESTLLDDLDNIIVDL
jgi:hypothetical protein